MHGQNITVQIVCPMDEDLKANRLNFRDVVICPNHEPKYVISKVVESEHFKAYVLNDTLKR